MRNKKILWAINLYSRVNHLRVHEELIRKAYGDFFDILVYTGNELFDRFPDEVFKYKEDILVRVPDDPSRHDTGGGHGGSHNGDKDAYNYVRTVAHNYDYIIWTAADAIFSDYKAVEVMMEKMIAGDYAFLSCVENTGHGRTTHGPRVHNEFFVVESNFYQKIFPLDGNYEGYNEDGSMPECMERTLGDLVQNNLGNKRWLVWPGVRHHERHYGNMELIGCGRICVENLFKDTIEFIKKYSNEYDYVMGECFPNGLLHDVRPNYDKTFEN